MTAGNSGYMGRVIGSKAQMAFQKENKAKQNNDVSFKNIM